MSPETTGNAEGGLDYFLVRTGSVDVLAVAANAEAALEEAVNYTAKNYRIFNMTGGFAPELLEIDPDEREYCRKTGFPRETRFETIRENNPIPGYAERFQARQQKLRRAELATAISNLLHERMDSLLDEVLILRTLDQLEPLSA